MVYGFGKIKSEIIIYLSLTKRSLRILHFSLIIKMRSDKMKEERVGYWLASVLFLFGIALLAHLASLSYYLTDSQKLLVLACVSIGGAFLLSLFTERCVGCHKYLGRMFFDSKKEYCPYCGCKFHDEWQKK